MSNSKHFSNNIFRIIPSSKGLTVKLFILLFSNIIFFVGRVFSQGYVSIPMGNCYWEITQSQTCITNSQTTGQSDLVYQVYNDSDTIIGSTSYKKLYSRIISNNMANGCNYLENMGRNGYVGAFREDTILKKVFMISPNDSNELLAYDFNLQIGDSVKTIYGRVPYPYNYRIVNNIYDQSYSDGICRKTYQLNSFSQSGVTGGAGGYLSGAGYYNEIIEGIGNNQGINNILGGEFRSQLPNWEINEGWHMVFAINAIPIYKTTPNTCTQNVTNVNTAKSNIDIFPNPVSDVIHISLNNLSEKELVIMITDLVGKEILITSQTEINVEQLENGFYILKFSNASGTVFHTKIFIKE